MESDTGNWIVRTWQTYEGLPDNSVTGVAQSKDGFLWLSTLAGLARFDGNRFEAFSPMQIPGVINRNVRKMFLDSHGAKWIALERGFLVRATPTSARVFSPKDGMPDSRIASFAEDKDGNIWFATGSEIFCVRNDRVEHFGPKEGVPAGGTPWVASDTKGQIWFFSGQEIGICTNGHWQTITALDSTSARFIAARDGGIWICTSARVLKMSGGGEVREVIRLPERVSVRALLEDHKGFLWIGTGANGLWRLDNAGFEHVAVSSPEISALAEDFDGNLWIGTMGGGVSLLQARVIDLASISAGLPLESVRSVCQDRDGWNWTVLQNGSLARGRDGHWSPVSHADGWVGADATCIAPNFNGGIWIGTSDQGVLKLQDGKTEPLGPNDDMRGMFVRSLLPDSNGDLWFATDNPSRLWKFSGGQLRQMATISSYRSIRALAGPKDGVVWAGTSDGQLLRIEKDYVENKTGLQSEGPFSIRCLQFTDDGSLWIGYAGWGLARWRDGKYTRIDEEHGLRENYISQIQADAQGRLWLTGNLGLFSLRTAEFEEVAAGKKKDLQCIAYGRSEGLPSFQPAHDDTPSSWQNTDGTLCFATRNGLLNFQPAKILENITPTPVLVSQISLNDQVFALYDSGSPMCLVNEPHPRDLHGSKAEMKLPPDYNKLEFSYTALNFVAPENVRFRHRLKGFDAGWIEAGANRTVQYPRLPAGKYEFLVTACNEAGVWNDEGFALPFAVDPFYWQTWWFRLLTWSGGAGAGAYTVIFFYRQRARRKLVELERQNAIERERARIARDIHDDLGSNLTRIVMLSETASENLAQRQTAADLAEICQTSREMTLQLSEIVWAVNPEDDTLDSFATYIAKYATDFLAAAHVRCELDVPTNLPAQALDSAKRHNVFLAFKEALSNAAKHSGAKTVRVGLEIADDHFSLAIEDDGRGFDPIKRSGGHGLTNMSRRLAELGGECKIESDLINGTRVRLTVPRGK